MTKSVHLITIQFCPMKRLQAQPLISHCFLLTFIYLFFFTMLIEFFSAQLLYEPVSSLPGGRAVITTVMSGGAEERSPRKRKATVRRRLLPPQKLMGNWK